MADGRLKIGRKVRSKLFCHQKKIWSPNSKIHDFNLEKHTPQKGPFGGWIWRPYNCNVTCAVTKKKTNVEKFRTRLISLPFYIFLTSKSVIYRVILGDHKRPCGQNFLNPIGFRKHFSPLCGLKGPPTSQKKTKPDQWNFVI